MNAILTERRIADSCIGKMAYDIFRAQISFAIPHLMQVEGLLISKNAYPFHSHLAQDMARINGYHNQEGKLVVRRYLIPLFAFLLGSTFVAGIYFGFLILAQEQDGVLNIFLSNRQYVIPIWVSFGIQVALYSILRFRLFIPAASPGYSVVLIGTSGSTSVTAMVACCLHHLTDVLPILGLSAAATFLTRYQRPFMLVGLGMNILGIVVMLMILYREYRKIQPSQNLQPVLETE